MLTSLSRNTYITFVGIFIVVKRFGLAQFRKGKDRKEVKSWEKKVILETTGSKSHRGKDKTT